MHTIVRFPHPGAERLNMLPFPIPVSLLLIVLPALCALAASAAAGLLFLLFFGATCAFFRARSTTFAGSVLDALFTGVARSSLLCLFGASCTWFPALLHRAFLSAARKPGSGQQADNAEARKEFPEILPVHAHLLDAD
jgi:hypothetical protein